MDGHAPGRILVVEDDEATRYALVRALEAEGFVVAAEADGEAGLEAARTRTHDVVVLDWLLPRLSGIDVCRALRRESPVPIVMLTAREAEVDRVVGLEVGADDYVSKPFSTPELVARVRALLRRRALDAEAPATRRVGTLELDVPRHVVRVEGRQVALTPTEFRLLSFLAEARERVVTRQELVREVWNTSFVGDERGVDVHVRNIRRKIEDDPSSPRRLVTVRGVGYRLLPA